jgi:hypothetical protein
MKYGLAAGGVFLLFGPQILELLKKFIPRDLFAKKAAPPSPAAGIGFTESLTSLAEVRQRLIDTGGVPKDAESAIEVLTHALIAGSDK